MTAKQQAAELIAKFHPHCGGTEPMQTENAKKCALIAVDHILQPVRLHIEVRAFLNEVKREIQNYEV